MLRSKAELPIQNLLVSIGDQLFLIVASRIFFWGRKDFKNVAALANCLLFLTWLSSPSVISIKKKRIDHN